MPRSATRDDVVNVGAGAGSYEPPDAQVTAVEPSARDDRPAARRARRRRCRRAPKRCPSRTAPSTPRWRCSPSTTGSDLDAGLARDAAGRPAPRRHRHLRPRAAARFWFVRDYFPAIVGLHAERIASAAWPAKLPAASVEPIPVPRDCTDLFFAALWARPEMVLDPEVVRPMWVWQRLPEEDRRAGAASGSPPTSTPAPGTERNGHLRELDELDVGLRLIVSELAG